ncbi:GAF domain-containing protein [Streptomyces sp. enrichment culture]|uniref:GAF domain-containing protein n=1 Tax=Streptomyces sp. enrichment culture TaxID=1795815 RepID=UPI003F55B1D0
MTPHTHTLAPLAPRRPAGVQPVPGQPELVLPARGPVRAGQDLITAQQARTVTEQQARHELIQHLGMPMAPDELMDEFADRLAEETGMLYGFVNILLADQRFVGLHNPPPDSGHLLLGRTMSLEHGWCPAVVRRKKALPLYDVYASPRFSGNYVVDAVGTRSYIGTPVIHPKTGIVLCTACVTDPEPRSRKDARRILGAVKEAGRDILHTFSDTPR